MTVLYYNRSTYSVFNISNKHCSKYKMHRDDWFSHTLPLLCGETFLRFLQIVCQCKCFLWISLSNVRTVNDYHERNDKEKTSNCKTFSPQNKSNNIYTIKNTKPISDKSKEHWLVIYAHSCTVQWTITRTNMKVLFIFIWNSCELSLVCKSR